MRKVPTDLAEGLVDGHRLETRHGRNGFRDQHLLHNPRRLNFAFESLFLALISEQFTYKDVQDDGAEDDLRRVAPVPQPAKRDVPKRNMDVAPDLRKRDEVAHRRDRQRNCQQTLAAPPAQRTDDDEQQAGIERQTHGPKIEQLEPVPVRPQEDAGDQHRDPEGTHDPYPGPHGNAKSLREELHRECAEEDAWKPFPRKAAKLDEIDKRYGEKVGRHGAEDGNVAGIPPCDEANDRHREDHNPEDQQSIQEVRLRMADEEFLDAPVRSPSSAKRRRGRQYRSGGEKRRAMQTIAGAPYQPDSTSLERGTQRLYGEEMLCGGGSQDAAAAEKLAR